MSKFKSAERFLKDAYARRLLPAGRRLRERLVVRPLQLAGPYLRKGLVVRPLLFSFITIGGVLIVLGIREYRQSPDSPAVSSASASTTSPAGSTRPQPREITCADLAASGPGDSAYVRLTDFELTDHYLRRAPTRGSEWAAAYVPAVPLRVKDSPAVRPQKVLVRSSAVRNHRQLYDLERQPIEGMIVKGIGSLESDEQALLRKSYPHIDLDACWLLEAGSMPAASATAGASAEATPVAGVRGSGSVLGKIGGGAGLVAVAAGMLLLAGRRA